MENAVLLTTIMERSQTEKFRAFFLENGVPAVFKSMALGTVSSEIMDYLSLGSTEKGVLFAVLPHSKAKALLKAMDNKFSLYIPGRGIACTVPLSSFAGAAALKYLTNSDDIGKPAAAQQEDNNMTEQNQTKHELIVAIANHGYSEQVMEAARAANARGGTVLHATGTGSGPAESFFGININPDKDMLFIVATSAAKNAIMKSIVAAVGVATEAHAIVFSLPVSDIAGLRVEE